MPWRFTATTARAFSQVGFSKVSTEMEESIYRVLTVHRWDSLNHMDYMIASLRPVHGKLALKFLNWFIKQPGGCKNSSSARKVFCCCTDIDQKPIRTAYVFWIGMHFIYLARQLELKSFTNLSTACFLHMNFAHFCGYQRELKGLSGLAKVDVDI